MKQEYRFLTLIKSDNHFLKITYFGTKKLVTLKKLPPIFLAPGPLFVRRSQVPRIFGSAAAPTGKPPLTVAQIVYF